MVSTINVNFSKLSSYRKIYQKFRSILISWLFSLVCRDENKLFYDGNEIAKLEEESIIVGETVKTAKSTGIKKLRLRTAESVAI